MTGIPNGNSNMGNKVDKAFTNYGVGMMATSAALTGAAGMCLVAPEIYYFGMRNPAMFSNGLDFIESYLPGVPTMSRYGILGATANNAFGPNWTGE